MSNQNHADQPLAMADSPHGTDGALGRIMRLRKSKHTAAIFIHAGAGFHSPQNERVHLEACSSASEMGMRFLRAGSTATQSVEAALRILENKEITNAGYGSNLSIDGTVECDATVVDHLGRSGACGAVPGVRNPISLAKLILDTSNKPLSLRRVPPNALVGEGARIFAQENGVVTCPNDHLVSKNARDRFIRWQMDLHRAEGKVQDARTLPTADQGQTEWDPCNYDTVSSPQVAGCPLPRDHGAAILASTWNEGQPDCPNYGIPDVTYGDGDSQNPWRSHELPSRNTETSYHGSQEGAELNRHMGKTPSDGDQFSPGLGSRNEDSRLPEAMIPASNDVRNRGGEQDASQAHSDAEGSRYQDQWDGVHSGSPSTGPSSTFHGIKRPRSQTNEAEGAEQPRPNLPYPFPSSVNGEDFITDTVGAIAVDENGHIAAGSSSGGIGMKHRGRLGPAALVGVGTAIVPCSESDTDSITVAAVTSGTGEHMVTTMASQKCAERIYHGTRMGQGGADVQEDDEDAIMESFIINDFMKHPGVKSCHSAAAIGVMAVKKTPTGYYLYFAHNTDSFALASMGANDKQPVCTMSRLPKGATIARGGLKVRLD